MSIDKPLAADTLSTITVNAIDIEGKPVEGYIFKLVVSIKDKLATTKEGYTFNTNTDLNKDTVINLVPTGADGKVIITVGVSKTVDPADGLSLSIAYNEGTTYVALSFDYYSVGAIPPVLSADNSDITIDNNIEIAFTDDIQWTSGIYSVEVNGTDLVPTTDYETGTGKIILKPSGSNVMLTTSGVKNITFKSAGYDDAQVQQTILPGAVDSNNSFIKQILKFCLNSSVILEANARDKYNNPIPDYVFKWKATYFNNTSTTAETYKIAGTNISSDYSDGALSATNEKGYLRFRVIIPATVDKDDGLDLQLMNNAGTGDAGQKISYRNDGSQRLTAYIHEIKNQPDYSFENGTAQSDHFIIFWGEKAGADPTTTAVSTAAKFDPQNVLDVLESVYDFYAKEIGFLDTSIGSPSKYKFIIEISNTWRDASINGWAYGGYITSTKGENIGWMQLAADATKGGNGLAHEFAHAVQSTGTRTPVGGNIMEVDANFASIQFSNNNIGSVDMGRFILTQHFPWLTGRHYYVCWYFMQLLVDKYGKDFIGRCYNHGNGGDLIENYKYILGKTQSDVCNEFGEHAMRNVIWDYSNGKYIRDLHADFTTTVL